MPKDIQQILSTPFGIFSFIIIIILGICWFAVFISIFINFVDAKENSEIQFKKKSFVETGSMMAFFFILILIIRLGLGRIFIESEINRIILMLIGIIFVVFGSFVNIRGRFDLKTNWANQVVIYKNQFLVNSGMYSKVRHPLYASIMLMFFGLALIFTNYFALVLNIFIFIPFMYYRAKQEENALTEKFGEDYKNFQKKVGMFFPKLDSNSNKL